MIILCFYNELISLSYNVINLALAWMFLAGPVIQCMAEDPINNSGLKTYSCSELLGLRGGGALPSPGLLRDVPDELCSTPGGKVPVRQGLEAR